ncbi:MAG: xylulokinase [Clostridia bacterium]|nr:xylulokinase [Clostridia bacterium]
MPYYIGADLGTSALKLILCDVNKNIVKIVTEEYDVYYPHHGWSEQNPVDWWNAFVSGVRKLINGIDKEKVSGIAVAGQMHGLVILDGEDKVIRPAILWNDSRCSKETDYLNNTVGKQNLSDFTANIAFAGFTAPKILWLQNNEKENFERIEKIMLPKDYINYCLTGVHSTDYSDASGTLLLDVKNRCWSQNMLEICGIKESRLPKLFESYEKIGSLKCDAAEQLGLSKNVFVAAGAGDNAGAAIGTGTVGEGKCNISVGTSGTVFISSEKFSMVPNNALHAFCHADGGYHLMGCMLSAASCNKWLCEEIFKTEDYSKEQSYITDDMLGNNSVYFLPYLMGERSPINDTDASGVFIGLRADTKRSDMLLAVLEGVAFAIRDSMETAKKSGICIKRSTVCGGGAKSELWLKIFANVLNIELDIPKTEQGPGYGAAILAMADGNKEKIISEPEIIRSVKPDRELSALYEKRYNKFIKLYPNIKNLYQELKEEI